MNKTKCVDYNHYWLFIITYDYNVQNMWLAATTFLFLSRWVVVCCPYHLSVKVSGCWAFLRPCPPRGSGRGRLCGVMVNWMTFGYTGPTAPWPGIGNVSTQYRSQKPNCQCCRRWTEAQGWHVSPPPPPTPTTPRTAHPPPSPPSLFWTRLMSFNCYILITPC